MGNIILTKDEINNLKMLSENSVGCFGKCYDYNGKVLKLFKRDIDPSDYQNIKRNMKRKSDIIMYPKNKAFLFDKKIYFKGYLCDKAPGIDLWSMQDLIKEGKQDILFDSFLTGYYDKFLPQLKKEDVLLEDVKLAHIFFHDCFYLIDSDWYTDRPSCMSTESKNRKNISQVNTYLNNFIFHFIPLSACNDSHFNVFMKNDSSEEYIEKVFEEIRKATNGEVDGFVGLFNYKFSDKENKESILIK